MKKRILSFLLAAVMLVGAVFTTAIAAEETLYPDVAADRWSAADIAYVTENGMMKDTGDGDFEPAKAVTRAMVVTVLYRMAGEPEVRGGSRFTDVEDGQWYADPVAWGSANNLVMGFSGGIFKPNDPVTREQLVTFIGRFAEYGYIVMNGDGLEGFTDSGKIQDYAAEYFKWAVKVGLVKGVTEDEIRPEAGATREQFAAIIHRFDTLEESGAQLEYEVKYNEPMTGSYEINKEYSLVEDADFYVATDGDDSNPGTIDRPFKTFEKAKEAVREFKKTATEEIVVAFKAGDYGYLDNITFTPEDAGSAEVPIKYCKYGDGDVVFSNGVNIKNEEFKPIDESDHYLFAEKNYEKISKAYIGDRIDKIGQFTVLFDGSQICWEARFPNKVDGVDQYIVDMSTRVDQFKSIELQLRAKNIADGFRSTEGMKMTGHFRTGWLIDTFLVESYDKETGIVEFDFDNEEFYPWGDYPMVKWDHGIADENGDLGEYVLMYEERYNDSLFFHNLSDQLDQAGEYWVDTETMTLYVYDVDGDYTFSNGGTFMTVQRGADHISFVGLEFGGSSENAVYSYGDNITFDLCKFENISGSCALTATGVKNFTLSNSEFHKFGAQGLTFSANADHTMLVSGNSKIYNNYFHEFGFIDYWKNAMSYSDVGGVVSHNVFENGAHGGISYSGALNIIEYNVFDNLMISTEDFGCVYTWNNSNGRGNEIRYNLFKNIIHGNKYSIYLDEMTHGQLVHGNIFYDASQAVVQNGGRDNEMYDNIIISTPAFTSSAKLYHYYETGTTEDFKNQNGAWGQYKLTMTGFPTEGHPAYELWLEKWPIIYKYHTDITKIGEPECVFSNTNYYRYNHLINSGSLDVNGDHIVAKTGVFEGNEEYGLDENRLFVNPALGDYRLRDDADFAEILFEKIGRE